MTRKLEQIIRRHERGLKGVQEGRRPRPWQQDMTVALEIIERQAAEIERLEQWRANAWDDGYVTGYDDLATEQTFPTRNPYRKDAT